jgi:hypothetical protein
MAGERPGEEEPAPAVPSHTLRHALRERGLDFARELYHLHLEFPGRDIEIYLAPVQPQEDYRALQSAFVDFRAGTKGTRREFIAYPIYATDDGAERLAALGWPSDRPVFRWESPRGWVYLLPLRDEDDEAMIARVVSYFRAPDRPFAGMLREAYGIERVESWEGEALRRGELGPGLA